MASRCNAVVMCRASAAANRSVWELQLALDCLEPGLFPEGSISGSCAVHLTVVPSREISSRVAVHSPRAQPKGDRPVHFFRALALGH